MLTGGARSGRCLGKRWPRLQPRMSGCFLQAGALLERCGLGPQRIAGGSSPAERHDEAMSLEGTVLFNLAAGNFVGGGLSKRRMLSGAETDD